MVGADRQNAQVIRLECGQRGRPALRVFGFQDANDLGDAVEQMLSACLRNDRRPFIPMQPQTDRLSTEQAERENQRHAREQTGLHAAQAHVPRPSTVLAST